MKGPLFKNLRKTIDTVPVSCLSSPCGRERILWCKRWLARDEMATSNSPTEQISPSLNDKKKSKGLSGYRYV